MDISIFLQFVTLYATVFFLGLLVGFVFFAISSALGIMKHGGST